MERGGSFLPWSKRWRRSNERQGNSLVAIPKWKEAKAFCRDARDEEDEVARDNNTLVTFPNRKKTQTCVTFSYVCYYRRDNMRQQIWLFLITIYPVRSTRKKTRHTDIIFYHHYSISTWKRLRLDSCRRKRRGHNDITRRFILVAMLSWKIQRPGNANATTVGKWGEGTIYDNAIYSYNNIQLKQMMTARRSKTNEAKSQRTWILTVLITITMLSWKRHRHICLAKVRRIMIIIKRIAWAPIYRTRWEHRALYNKPNNTPTHTHTHTHGAILRSL